MLFLYIGLTCLIWCEYMKICKFDGCERRAVSKGYCDKHYRRLLKRGDVNDSGSRKVSEGDAVERFHDKYDKKENGCWIWSASTRPNAKGQLYGRHHNEFGKSEGAHRFSYRVHNNEDISGKFVCHKCDTPLCVNPEHLFLSDHIGNMKDMRMKGRSARLIGENNHVSKLTDTQAEEIRKSELSQSKLAKVYGVSQATIGRIKRGQSYATQRLSKKSNR